MATNITISSSGFTYDQAATPNNPNRGDTWRQRNPSNNDIVQDWFRGQTHWLSIDKKTLLSSAGNNLTETGWALGATITATSIDALPPYSLFLEKLGVQFAATANTLTDGDWSFQFGSYAVLFPNTPTLIISNANKYSAGGYDFINQYVDYNNLFEYNSLYRLDTYATKSISATALGTALYSIVGIARIAR